MNYIYLDIEEFLDDKKEKQVKSEDDTNPFSALFSFAKRSPKAKTDPEKQTKKMTQLKQKGARSDKYAEKYIRNLSSCDILLFI